MLFPKSNEQVLLFLGEERKYDDKEMAHEKSSDTRLVFDAGFWLRPKRTTKSVITITHPLNLGDSIACAKNRTGINSSW
jgi:hypothetical protein